MSLWATLQTRFTDYIPKAIQKAGWLIIAFALGLVLLVGCYLLFFSAPTIQPLLQRMGDEIHIPPDSPLRSHLQLYRVEASNQPHRVEVPGMVEVNPSRAVNLYPPLSGHLVNLTVQLNDYVKEHDLLAVIISPDLAQASSDDERAKSSVQLATHALERTKAVFAAGGNSFKDVEIAEANYKAALAEAKRTQAQLQALSATGFSQLELRAPMNGYITVLNYGQDAYITDLTVPLLALTNLDSVWVTANIPEDLSALVKANQAVEITFPALPGVKVSGRVHYVNVMLDAETRCNKTRIDLDNRQLKLQPNQFASVYLSLPEQAKIIVPLSAILMNNDTTTVFIETSPWVFKRRQVSLGREDGEQVRILSGLNSGDRIVQKGGIFIND